MAFLNTEDGVEWVPIFVAAGGDRGGLVAAGGDRGGLVAAGGDRGGIGGS